MNQIYWPNEQPSYYCQLTLKSNQIKSNIFLFKKMQNSTI